MSADAMIVFYETDVTVAAPVGSGLGVFESQVMPEPTLAFIAPGYPRMTREQVDKLYDALGVWLDRQIDNYR